MFPASFSLSEILVLSGNAGAGGIAPPASTRISTRMKCVQRHLFHAFVNMLMSCCGLVCMPRCAMGPGRGEAVGPEPAAGAAEGGVPAGDEGTGVLLGQACPCDGCSACPPPA